MEKIINYLIYEFNKLEPNINVFEKYLNQNEGWFMGNILFFLDKYFTELEIIEVIVDKGFIGNVDLCLKTKNSDYYIELKNWLTRKGYPLSSYLSKGSGYWLKDIEKLKLIYKDNCKKYLVIFNNGIIENNFNIQKQMDNFEKENELKSNKLYNGKNFNVLLFEV